MSDAVSACLIQLVCHPHNRLLYLRVGGAALPTFLVDVSKFRQIDLEDERGRNRQHIKAALDILIVLHTFQDVTVDASDVSLAIEFDFVGRRDTHHGQGDICRDDLAFVIV